MTLAVILSLLASFIWAITNHIDKFMVSGIDDANSSIRILLVFSTFVAGLVLSPFWLIFSRFNISISMVSLICVLASSLTYIVATLLYFKAMY